MEKKLEDKLMKEIKSSKNAGLMPLNRRDRVKIYVKNVYETHVKSVYNDYILPRYKSFTKGGRK